MIIKTRLKVGRRFFIRKEYMPYNERQYKEELEMEETVLEHVKAIGEGANVVAKITNVKAVLWGSLASYAIYKCANNVKTNIEMDTIGEMAEYILNKVTGE